MGQQWCSGCGDVCKVYIFICTVQQASSQNLLVVKTLVSLLCYSTMNTMQLLNELQTKLHNLEKIPTCNNRWCLIDVSSSVVCHQRQKKFRTSEFGLGQKCLRRLFKQTRKSSGCWVFMVSPSQNLRANQSLARCVTTSYSLRLRSPLNKRDTPMVPLLACSEPVWTYPQCLVSSSGLLPRFSPVWPWYSPGSAPYLKLPAGQSWRLRFVGTTLRKYSTE